MIVQKEDKNKYTSYPYYASDFCKYGKELSEYANCVS